MADDPLQPVASIIKSDVDIGVDGPRMERLVERREKQRIRSARYYAANKEKVKEQSAAWSSANKERVRANKMAYRTANKRRIQAYRKTKEYRNKKRVWDATSYLKNKEKHNSRTAAYYEANKDKMRKQHVVWRKANPDKSNPSRVSYLKAWATANKDKIKASRTKTRPVRRERILAYMAAWHAANKEYEREYRKNNKIMSLARAARRRARRLGVQGSYTQAEVRALFTKQKRRCAYYGKRSGCLGIVTLAKLKKNTCHCDHIIPLVLPGSSNSISNIQLTCGPCNLNKRASDPIAFARQLGLLV